VSRQEFTGFASADPLARKQNFATFRRPGSDVAALAVVQIFCFLALARLEPRFFIIHLYQLMPYAAILLLVAYGQQRWAYTIAPLVSVAWFGLAYTADLLGSAVTRLRSVGSFGSAADIVAVLAVVTAILAVLMTVLSRIHWVRECSGRGRAWRTFFVSLGIVLAYYAILLRWFWDMIPNA
jgi:hypothetical protein